VPSAHLLLDRGKVFGCQRAGLGELYSAEDHRAGTDWRFLNELKRELKA
jgi:hypothetical protein